jgi:hypothetical protein
MFSQRFYISTQSPGQRSCVGVYTVINLHPVVVLLGLELLKYDRHDIACGLARGHLARVGRVVGRAVRRVRAARAAAARAARLVGKHL